MKIAIVGGGLGGLACALALLRRGYDVTVFEQASALGEVGAGIQLTPNGARALLSLGLEPALRAAGTQTTGKVIYLWNTADKRDFMRLGEQNDYGAPYLTFHRADLHGLLAKAVADASPSSIVLGKTCIGLEQHVAGARVSFDDGSAVDADVVIGADGVHSAVRRTLFGEDSARFTGCMAWRGLVSADDLPEEIDLRGGSMWLGPTAHIVTYPVRQGKLLNFIGMVDRDEWQVESWNARGTTEECLADFAGWHRLVQNMIEGIAVPYKWALIVREPLPTWTSGVVTLLGDACHSTLPFLSQGANMSFEDAVVLARCIEAGEGDVEASLQRYQAMRKERTEGIVAQSGRQLTRVHSPNLVERNDALAHIDREYQPDRVEDRYRWIYGYDAPNTDLV